MTFEVNSPTQPDELWPPWVVGWVDGSPVAVEVTFMQPKDPDQAKVAIELKSCKS